MTKQVDDKNQIWYEQDGKWVKMGLTRNFLDTLDECWHIIPSNLKAIKKKAPLFTIESNDGLVSLLSPVAGNLSGWDMKAANFPDKLTENDVIVTLSSEPVTRPAADDHIHAALTTLRAHAANPRPRAQPFADMPRTPNGGIDWAALTAGGPQGQPVVGVGVQNGRFVVTDDPFDNN